MPFKKGQSGNPNGRPKKYKSFTEALEKAITPDMLAKKLKELVMKGDVHAIKYCYDRIEGKPKDSEQSQQSQENQQVDYRQQVNREGVNYKYPEVEDIKVKSPGQVQFCSECGDAFSEKVINTINSRGYAFCQRCGNKYDVNPIQIQI